MERQKDLFKSFDKFANSTTIGGHGTKWRNFKQSNFIFIFMIGSLRNILQPEKKKHLNFNGSLMKTNRFIQ